MTIFLLIITFLLILCLCAGFYFFWGIRYCKSTDAEITAVNLSIIIPARNEEQNLPALLASINNQEFRPREVLVVNDSSTDRTRDVAMEYGSSVIEAKPLPEGWTGKNWACHQGSKEARGKLLLFLDADTRFEKDGLAKIVSEYTLNRGVISIAPYHRVKKLYEEFSFFFNILMVAGISAFTVTGTNSRNKGLFGQCMLVSKEDYLSVGGHEAVKGRILENFYLSRRFNDKGIAINCYCGKGTISMRMFPGGLPDLVEGWRKAFASGASNTPALTLSSIILWLIGAVTSFSMPIFTLATVDQILPIILSLAIYLIYALQMIWMLKKIGSYRFLTGLIFPVYLIFYNAVFAQSLLSMIFKKTVKWKERDVFENP